MVHHSASIASTAAFQGIPSLPPTLRHCNGGRTFSPGIQILPNAPLRGEPSPLCDLFPPAGRCSSHRRRRHPSWLQASSIDKEAEAEEENDQAKNPTEERDLLEGAMAHVESLEEILAELEALGVEGEEEDDFFLDEWDEETLEELFQSLPDDEEQENEETYLELSQKEQSTSLLETALLQGVVAPSAGVGSDCLPGDFNFDPLDLASKDYFPQAQAFFRNLIPAGGGDYDQVEEAPGPRPKALIIRDYREAELRHGRLAMLAAVFWPLQELLDRLVLDEDKFDSLMNSLFFGGVTLPYFPLLMTAIMLLLGYLDIYSQAIKDVDKIGDAFLPGDCFWDPLQMLTGAPDRMKRNMQERELFNGRMAMLAIAVYVFEELGTGKPIVEIPGNEMLFEPAYQIPFIHQWLDTRFSTPSPVFYKFSDTDLVEALTSVDLVLAKFGDSLALNL